jgi:plastocyanin
MAGDQFMKLKQFALIAAAVLAVSYGDAAASNDATVSISNFTFKPGALRIKVGTRVVFRNEDDIPHRVAGVDGSFYSKALDTDDQASFTFTTPGVFAYFCTLHPRMQGKIIVTP